MLRKKIDSEKLKNIVGTNQRGRDRKKIRVNGLIVMEHRHIWEQHNGKIPKDMFIHHKNGNPQDNHINNLQMVTRKEHGEIHKKATNKRLK